MLLNGEIKWLISYLLILIAAVITGIIVSWEVWQILLLAVLGIPVVIFGWLWQVGRYG
jgi:hypothetical protein